MLYYELQTGSLLSLKQPEDHLISVTKLGTLHVIVSEDRATPNFKVVSEASTILCLLYDTSTGFGKFLVNNCVAVANVQYVDYFFRIAQT